MNEKSYKRQYYTIITVIVLSILIMIGAIVSIIIAATKVNSADAPVKIVTVDNYIGKKTSEIKDIDLNFEYVEVYNEADAGTVVFQSVPPDTQVNCGTLVTLNVSKGSSSVVIPTIANATDDEAIKILKDNGFDVVVRYILNPGEKDEGIVEGCEPEAGVSVVYGSTVTVRVYGTKLEITTKPQETSSYQRNTSEFLRPSTTKAETTKATAENSTTEATDYSPAD